MKCLHGSSGHITRVGESYWKSVAPDARVLRYSKGRPDHGISDGHKNINLRKTMAYQPLYTAVATATGGRDGHVESSDGIVKLDLSVPREMGGPGKPGTSNSNAPSCRPFTGECGFRNGKSPLTGNLLPELPFPEFSLMIWVIASG